MWLASASLFGAQLTLGSATLAPAATTTIDASYLSQGSQVSAIQFDLFYDSTVMSVTATLGSGSVAAAKTLYSAGMGPNQVRVAIVGLNPNMLPDGAVLSLSVTVLPTASNGTYPIDVFSVAASDPAGGTVGVSATAASITVVGASKNTAPDLTITETHIGNFTAGQTGATYTITASNIGTAPTIGTVSVSAAVPAGLTPTAMRGPDWDCVQPAGPCTRGNSLAAGSNYPAVTLTVDVASNAASSVVSTAAVAFGGETNTNNDTAIDPTTILQTGLSISSINPNPVPLSVAGQTLLLNGSGFQLGAGLRVQLTNGGFQTDLKGAQVTFLSATQLSILVNVGSAATVWTVQVFNPNGQSSNVFPFTVDVPQTSSPSFAVPQFTFGGGWYTALYFANTTNTVAHIQVRFYGNDGGPLLVPLLGIGSVNSQGIDLSPHSTVILEAPNSSGPNQEGWADVALPSGVTGYAVFRQSIPGREDQEAVVPLTPETSMVADLTYDDILFTTAVALLNPTTQPLTVTITTFDGSGAPNGSAQVVLASRSKQASTLKAFPGLASISGNRGRAVFSVSGGAVSALGLRFGGSAFTSIPINHRPATGVSQTISLALPQLVFGNSWYTALYLSNTTTTTVNVPVSFTADDGSALAVELLGIGTVTGQNVTLNPGATATLEAPLTDSPGEGWSEATSPPGVTGYAVFRQSTAGRADQEAVVPLTPEASQVADLIYDDTAFTTSVALLNPSSQKIVITIAVYSENGTLIGFTQVFLSPHAKLATVLKDLRGLSGMAGNRGWATFSVPNGDVSVLGLRFGGSAFTSIPVNHR